MAAEYVERGADGLHDQVTLVAPDVVGTFTRDIDGQARLGNPDDDVVVERKRETEGVEPGAEGRAGRGHPHPRGRRSKGHPH